MDFQPQERDFVVGSSRDFRRATLDGDLAPAAAARSWCHTRQTFARPLAWVVAVTLWLSGCGGGDGSADTADSAARVASRQGNTPFIHDVQLSGIRVNDLATVRYTIAPKPGAASRPVDVSYSIAALARRGAVDSGRGVVWLPVFGLYPGYANQVSVELTFVDTSKQTMVVKVDTEPYVDPNGIYDRPNILKAREPEQFVGL